jgi:hypothetical protein
MFKLTAILAAAVCAGFIVTLAPGFGSEVVADTVQRTDQTDRSTPRLCNEGRGHRDCAQTWPYYEQSRLFEGREGVVNGRAVRVIAMDRSAALSPVSNKRNPQVR